jgi:hypothetical protein
MAEDMNKLIRRAAGTQPRIDADQALVDLAALLDDPEAAKQMTPAARLALHGYLADRARDARLEQPT